MSSRRNKYAGHAEHVLDAFLRLRSTYALLEPLLFKSQLLSRWRTGPAAQGRQIVLYSLLYSCVLEASKLTLDKDPRTPSVQALDAALNDEVLRRELREAYAVLNLHAGEQDPAVLELLQRMERQDTEKRREGFDLLVQSFRAEWERLCSSPILISFATLRDKVIAHNEVRHDGDKYRAFDVASLKLTFGDLRFVVQALEPIVDKANLIFRNASFAFDDLDRQLGAASQQFWDATGG